MRLYGGRWDLLFEDNEIRGAIEHKFERLARTALEIGGPQFEGSLIATQRDPFSFPHSDCTIYLNTMYAAGEDGVFAASCNEGMGLSREATKLWDAPCASVAGGFESLAIAAGQEGLFQLRVVGADNSAQPAAPQQLAPVDCTSCSWAFFSIFGSSHINGGCLADFRMVREEPGSRATRVLDSLISAEKLFGGREYSWGAQDKLCQVSGGQIKVYGYNPRTKRQNRRLVDLGSVDLAPWKGDVVSGAVAAFGTVVECDNAIVVIPSSGTAITIRGEPVNWRVFPRAKFYANQLHIVFDDRLEVYSFNHDYFVDQSEKVSGIKFRAIGGRSRWRPDSGTDSWE